MKLIALFVLGASLALAQPRPLDNIASRQYQHEVRPLRLALDRWLHELGLQGLFPLWFRDENFSIHAGHASPDRISIPCVQAVQKQSGI